MPTAARKKAKPSAQSTDRGGPVLLPLGILLLAFGLMLLLGSTLQTSASSLDLFKWMAIGLGGGFYMLVPLMIIWLATLMILSSKHYVSFYAFFISLLLCLCVLALSSLMLRIEDRSYPQLMAYIRNLHGMRGLPYPDSFGEYIKTSYSLRQHLQSANQFYPGGGALSMLFAYPLYAALGNTGAIVLLFLAVIGLIFALLRLSPVKLIAMISDRMHNIKPREAGTAAAQQAASSKSQPAQVYADQTEYTQQPVYADDPAKNSYPTDAWPAQPEPVQQTWVDQTYQQAQPQGQVFYQEPEIEPGFIPQNQDVFFEDFDKQPVQPVKRTVLTPKTPERKPAQPAGQPETLQRLPWEDQPAASKLDQEPEDIASQPEPGRRATARARNQEAALKQTKPEVQSPVQPIQAKQDELQAKPVHTAPAVPLTGERVPVRKPVEKPEKTSLDGMARAPVPQQIRLALDDYQVPPMRLLAQGDGHQSQEATEEDKLRAAKLIETLESFQITAHLHDIVHGPTVTRFAIRLAEGINVNKLRNVMDNLTIELKAKGDIRAEMPIPGTSFVGLEVSNDKTSKVYLRDVLESPRMRDNKSPTAVALGKDITGTPIVSELMDMPHLLIAGATGSGKSVCINSIICSMLYRASPRHVRLIMVDPKFVELQPYNDVPHLLMPVITDAKKATAALDWVCQEMDQRYQILVDAGVRNLDAYNRKLGPDEEPLPRIIVIVDEMADLMTTSGKMIEDHIKRITAKARAAGICLILATQRPSVNIITGVIKANIPGRIAFRVSSPFDSKTILDNQGAEKLLGYGDMLYRSMTREPIRVQGCFVSDNDVEQTVQYIKIRNKAEYNLDLMEHVEQSEQGENGNGMGDSLEGGDGEFDELLPQAIEMAVEAGQMSISMLQRVLRVGYARSGRLIDEMARRGIISGNEGTKARKTLMTREQYMSYLEEQGG